MESTTEIEPNICKANSGTNEDDEARLFLLGQQAEKEPDANQDGNSGSTSKTSSSDMIVLKGIVCDNENDDDGTSSDLAFRQPLRRRGRGTFGSSNYDCSSTSKDTEFGGTNFSPTASPSPVDEAHAETPFVSLQALQDIVLPRTSSLQEEHDDEEDRSDNEENLNLSNDNETPFELGDGELKNNHSDNTQELVNNNNIESPSSAVGRTKKTKKEMLLRQQKQQSALDSKKDAGIDFDDTSSGGDDDDGGDGELLETQQPPQEETSKYTAELNSSDSAAAQTEKEEHEEVRKGESDKLSKETSLAPTIENILVSTERLFKQVDDSNAVTVKDIIRSLSEEYSCKISKSIKAAVREHLTHLLIGPGEDKENDDGDDEVSDVGQAEDSDDDFDDDASRGSEYENNSDDDEEDEGKARRKKKTKKKLQSKKASASQSRQPRRSRRNSTSGKKAKVTAMRVHAEKLRKRRMEELRVRNEELQLHQSEQDQQRAEEIARKFDTNTDEQRIQRLEHRMGLLQKLDMKRITVIQEDSPSKKIADPTAVKEEEKPAGRTDTACRDKEKIYDSADGGSGGDDDNSDDDEDMELEIVGEVEDNTLARKLQSKPTALSLLDMADSKVRRSHLKQMVTTTTATQQINANGCTSSRSSNNINNGALSLLLLSNAGGNAGGKQQASPGRSLSARAALKTALLSKQRKRGNLWLARELGYKSEHEHLRDCIQVEQRKRQLILKQEQERLKKNEMIRQRLLVDGDNDECEEEAEFEDDHDSASGINEEEDEEMALAKAIANGSEPNDDTIKKGGKESKEPDSDSPHEEATYNSPPTEVTGFDPAEVDPSGNNSSAKDIDGDGGGDAGGEDCSIQLETQAPWPPSAMLNASTDGVTHLSSKTDDKADAIEATNDEPQEVSNAELSDDDDGAPAPFDDDDTEETMNKESAEARVEVLTEEDQTATEEKPKGPRNSAWQAMLKKDAEQARKMRKRKNGLVEEEADEEEEEQIAGLEDFGFSIANKKRDDDEDEKADDIDEDDLKGVVDDVSDDEGDEEAGEKARKALERQEEKERHKEIIRRMRNGYDGRRGGIAVGGAGARGIHRFDELVAADNREDAKRLGLLNDDEFDSDDDEEGGGGGKENKGGDNDEEEDEAALLDKMLKDRFLHRSSVDLDENFSDDEDDAEDDEDEEGGRDRTEVEEQAREQERLAKRFAKRARMQRLIEAHGHEEEFSQSKLLEEDVSLKLDLQKMKNGLSRKRSVSSSSNVADNSNASDNNKKPKTIFAFGGGLLKGGSLAFALQASNSRNKQRTSFLRSSTTSYGSNNESTASFQKSISFSHVVFQSADSRSNLSNPGVSTTAKTVSSTGINGRRNNSMGRSNKASFGTGKSTSLWSKAVGFHKTR